MMKEKKHLKVPLLLVGHSKSETKPLFNLQQAVEFIKSRKEGERSVIMTLQDEKLIEAVGSHPTSYIEEKLKEVLQDEFIDDEKQ